MSLKVKTGIINLIGVLIVFIGSVFPVFKLEFLDYPAFDIMLSEQLGMYVIMWIVGGFSIIYGFVNHLPSKVQYRLKLKGMAGCLLFLFILVKKAFDGFHSPETGFYIMTFGIVVSVATLLFQMIKFRKV